MPMHYGHPEDGDKPATFARCAANRANCPRATCCERAAPSTVENP